MKKVFPFLFFLLGSSTFGQIVINNNYAWQQYIPLITGGSSIQVSNVQVQGSPVAFGYYQALQNELDLGQGILMTSGTASDSGPDSPFGPNTIPNAGLDNLAPGHWLADQISGQITFNASVIEFDFSSPVQDTLQLSYLFASEEYKEYVGTEFNDVFGFFVTTGPGITTPVNIALLPDTNVAIAINNVNHLQFSSYYYDNDLPTPGTLLQYDGWVKLKTRAFPIVPDSIYHIILLIADASDGIYDSGVFLELIHGKQNVCGQIFYEGLPAGPGTVELIGYRLDETNIEVLDTAFTNASGEFQFDSVDYGGYIFRSVLNPIDYPLSYPVYIDSAVIWNMATIQYYPTLDSSCNELYHKELITGTGPGVIAGYILNDNLIKIIGPVSENPSCYIFAIDQNNQVAAYSQINSKGEYSLNGLEEGVYTLLIDYLGYSMVDTNWINITSTAYNYEAHYLAKNKEKEIRRLLEEPQVSDALYTVLYPNPSHGDFTMFINSPEVIRDLEVYVSDTRGRIIFTQTLSNIPEGQSFYRFDLTEANPANGVYIIRMQNEKVKNISKILIE